MPLTEDGQVYRSLPATIKNWPIVRRAKLSRFHELVADVLDRGAQLRLRSDEELKILAGQLRERTGNGAPLDSLLVDCFSCTREVARRVLGMEHYPVQILGGIGLHFGNIIEMATGEGKTLCATLPATLNALSDRGVHIVTVNDYLARRDADEMGPIYRFMGLTVAAIQHEMPGPQRRSAYRASITYVTNKEAGFDFLRDEMSEKGQPWFAFGKKLSDLSRQGIHRPILQFAIVDEADSILIDEARTPLILSSRPPLDPELAHEFRLANSVVHEFEEGVDFEYDRKEKRLEWFRAGEDKVVRLLGGQRSLTGHRVDWHEACLRALKAHVLFRKDVEYVVDEGEVVIVDEFTGRKMPGRQWEDGLHQAVECKEGVEIHGRTETLARTTYQIYFNHYEKLAGMTGTAMTDARELAEVFGLGTLPIPTHRARIRKIAPDVIFATEDDKWNAVVERVQQAVAIGQPVLIGTRSIDKSEILSSRLSLAGVGHEVLNARHEANEAKIVAAAGQMGRVTVATNMAGRGTDIKLAPGVAEVGGLLVIGTERHESRRVDLQLIGRCGRQGDPGLAQFFLSLEDPLLQRYRPRKTAWLQAKYRNQSGPIKDASVRNFFTSLQLAIERQHRKSRRDLLKYEREQLKFNRQIGVE